MQTLFPLDGEAVANPQKSPPSDLTPRLMALRDSLVTGLVERDVPVRLALLAALAGEHVLLIGPPGTAKSLVARRLHLAFENATYFERLLTRFSVPEELFGPLSIKGLEEDRYERLTESYLPRASIAFLDEIFKANSAILNALLTLLNEREFDNGARREPAPLIAAVGASNELPAGEELDALFDRFLLRVHVGPVSKACFPALLDLRGDMRAEVPQDVRLSLDDLAALRTAATSVTVPPDVMSLLADLRDWCIAENIQISDRRWRKIVKLLQTAALTNGRTSVSIWDCWLLQHCLWNEPEQQAKVYQWYTARAGASAAMNPSRLTRIVMSWEGKLKHDQNSRTQARDADGNLLFTDADGTATTNAAGSAQLRRNREPLFLAPAKAKASNHYGGHLIVDRTQGGLGFTRTELDEFWVDEVASPGTVRFERWSQRDAYLADKANWHVEERDFAPLMEPTRHKPTYVDACLDDLRELRQQVDAYQQKLLAHIASLDADIRGHLWVTDDFAEPAGQSLQGTRREVDALLARIDQLRQGFERLPREEAIADTQEFWAEADAAGL